MGILAWLLGALAVLLALAGLLLLDRGLFRDPARGRKRCPKCWYDMMGTAGLRCPECGHGAKSDRHLLKTRRHCRPIAAGGGLLVLAAVSAGAPLAVRDPWSLVPSPVLFLILQFYDDEADQLFTRVAGQVAAGSKTSAWERLLLARACASEIRGRVALLEASQPGGADASAQFVWSLQSDPQLSRALELLKMLGAESRPAIPTVVGMLESTHAPTRTLGVFTLGQIGPVTPAVSPAVIRALDDQDFEVVMAAISALAAFGRDQTIPVDRLIALLANEQNWQARAAIAGLLAKHGHRAARAAPALEQVAREDRDLFVKLAATKAIARIEPSDRARARFRSLLLAPEYEVRVAAGRTLEAMRGEAIPDLAAITKATHEGQGRLAATGIDILLTFRGDAVPHLAELAANEHPGIASPAAYALGRLGTLAADAVPALAQALEHPGDGVRFAAMNALERIGSPAATAIPVLERLAEEGDETTALAARHTIAALRADASRLGPPRIPDR